jgi:hypothetical protein
VVRARNLTLRLFVLWRVRNVDAAAEHADGLSPGRERALVRRGIDASGQPTHHASTPHGKRTSQGIGRLQPRPGRPAGPNDGHGQSLPHLPTHKQRGRGIWREPETRGIRLVGVGDHPKPLTPQTVVHRRGVETFRQLGKCARRVLAQPHLARKLGRGPSKKAPRVPLRDAPHQAATHPRLQER